MTGHLTTSGFNLGMLLFVNKLWLLKNPYFGFKESYQSVFPKAGPTTENVTRADVSQVGSAPLWGWMLSSTRFFLSWTMAGVYLG